MLTWKQRDNVVAELSSEARAVLERARQGQPGAGAAVRARVRARVDATLAGGGTSAPSGAGKVPFLTKIGLASGVVLLGVSAWHWGGSTVVRAPTPPSSAQPALAAASSAGMALADAPAAGREDVASPALEGEGVPHSSHKPGHTSGLGATGYSLKAEVELLDGATQALLAGDLAATRKLLEVHRQRFKRPQLLEERTGLGILADCMSDSFHTKARASAFARAHPSGVLTARIERECKLGDGT